MRHHQLLDRVRNEFLEMPGLSLTPDQASRLWGVDGQTCRQMIDDLVATAFLRWTRRGQLVRRD